MEEREEREQQCRDQVDLGLMRMERLKEENAAAAATATAAVTSPPVSFAGSTAASPPFLAQVTFFVASFRVVCREPGLVFEQWVGVVLPARDRESRPARSLIHTSVPP